MCSMILYPVKIDVTPPLRSGHLAVYLVAWCHRGPYAYMQNLLGHMIRMMRVQRVLRHWTENRVSYTM